MAMGDFSACATQGLLYVLSFAGALVILDGAATIVADLIGYAIRQWRKRC